MKPIKIRNNNQGTCSILRNVLNTLKNNSLFFKK